MNVLGPPLAALSVSHHLNAIYLFVTLCLLSFWLLPKLRLAHSDNFIGIGFCLSLVRDWLGVRVGTGLHLGTGPAPQPPYAIHQSAFLMFFLSSVMFTPYEFMYVCGVLCVRSLRDFITHIWGDNTVCLVIFQGPASGTVACAKLLCDWQLLNRFSLFRGPPKWSVSFKYLPAYVIAPTETNSRP